MCMEPYPPSACTCSTCMHDVCLYTVSAFIIGPAVQTIHMLPPPSLTPSLRLEGD